MGAFFSQTILHKLHNTSERAKKLDQISNINNMTWTKLHELCGTRSSQSNTEAIISQTTKHPKEVGECTNRTLVLFSEYARQTDHRVSVETIAVSLDDHGFTPLHIAVLRDDPSKDVIQALLKAQPNAVMKKVSIRSV